MSKRAIGFSVSGMFVEETSRLSILTSARAFTRTTLPRSNQPDALPKLPIMITHGVIGGGPSVGTFASVSAPGTSCETQTGGDETGLTHQSMHKNYVRLKIMPPA